VPGVSAASTLKGLVLCDEAGWERAIRVTPFPLHDAWSLFAPDAVARVEPARWSQQARTHLSADVVMATNPADPSGLLPTEAAFELDVASTKRPSDPTRVRVATVTLTRAPEALAAAHAGVAAIGGAGFDALIARAQRLWQVRATPVSGSDARAPIVVAALLAFVLFAPVVPPGGGTIFGMKGARTKLDALGWFA
jgi:hypothetical protein